MEDTKESIAIVIENDEGEFLVVQRASDDSFAGHWGLPAASPRNGETNEDAVARAAKDKLGVEVKIVDTVGDMTMDKGDYLEHLTEYRVKIIKGKPSLAVRDSSVSKYADWKYTSDPSVLIPAAKHGSICSRIYLTYAGINWDAS